MPITASFGALTTTKGAQTSYPGSRYIPSTTGAGHPYGFENPGPYVTDLVDITSATGFTIEYWVRFTSIANGSGELFLGNFDTGFTFHWGVAVGSDGRIVFRWNGGYIRTTLGGYVTNNNWANVAVVLTTTGGNTTITVFVNGTIRNIQLNGAGSSDPSITVSSSVLTYDVNQSFALLPRNQTPSQLGYFDEIRVSNIDRYSANYSVATQQFTPDSNTQLLLHFVYDTEYGTNLTPIIDSSQNNLSFTNWSSQANLTYYKF